MRAAPIPADGGEHVSRAPPVLMPRVWNITRLRGFGTPTCRDTHMSESLNGYYNHDQVMKRGSRQCNLAQQSRSDAGLDGVMTTGWGGVVEIS